MDPVWQTHPENCKNCSSKCAYSHAYVMLIVVLVVALLLSPLYKNFSDDDDDDIPHLEYGSRNSWRILQHCEKVLCAIWPISQKNLFIIILIDGFALAQVRSKFWVAGGTSREVTSVVIKWHITERNDQAGIWWLSTMEARNYHARRDRWVSRVTWVVPIPWIFKANYLWAEKLYSRWSERHEVQSIRQWRRQPRAVAVIAAALEFSLTGRFIGFV